MKIASRDLKIRLRAISVEAIWKNWEDYPKSRKT